MAKNNHLSLYERIQIQTMLTERKSFKAISRVLNRNCSTISKEIRSHLVFEKKGCFGNNFNDCSNRFNCSLHSLCSNANCKNKLCKNCSHCHMHCKDYSRQECQLLLQPPYVCNGCCKRTRCTLEKHVYSASIAQKEYKQVLSESRSGLAITEEEISYLDSIISPLIRKGQSVHHIYINKTDTIMCSEKSIYSYIDAGLLSVNNIDLPRKVMYRTRKSKHDSFKVDKKCRIGRTYEDYLTFCTNHPDLPLVEIDSVLGIRGGKVLLTIHFVQSQFMLAYLRDANTAASVSDILERLYWTLRPDIFSQMFPLILTDNGSEFSNPNAIEYDAEGNRRSRIFYCDPSKPFQKGAIEVNHELIRRVLPKGTSFDDLTQEKVMLMMNHINSYKRKKLGDKSPYQMFQMIYGTSILEKLEAQLILDDDITLLPTLLK